MYAAEQDLDTEKGSDERLHQQRADLGGKGAVRNLMVIDTADGERVWSLEVGANLSRWILRDLSGQVLREYINNQGTWSLAEDYFYRDSLLLAAEPPAGRRHFHLDHLGTWSRKRAPRDA